MATHERRQGEELAAQREKRFGKRPATLPPSATADVVNADEG